MNWEFQEVRGFQFDCVKRRIGKHLDGLEDVCMCVCWMIVLCENRETEVSEKSKLDILVVVVVVAWLVLCSGSLNTPQALSPQRRLIKIEQASYGRIEDFSS